MALCVGGLTGCQALEAAKNNVVAEIKSSRLKSDIESRCKQYEAKNDGSGMKEYLNELLKAKPDGWDESVEKFVDSQLAKANSMLLAKLTSDIESHCKQYEAKNDGAGMKAYLDGLIKANPKPDGWDESVEKLVDSELAKARSMLLYNRIQGTYDNYIAKGEVDKANEYLAQILADKDKTADWNESIEKLVNDLLAKISEEVLKCRCATIWAGVKAALDNHDFTTARKLTATAAPCAEESIREKVLVYRIGVLNEIINPYQSDWIIHQMQSKVAELRQAGKNDDVRTYVDSVGLIKDEIPSIEQKVLAIKPGLENLYWFNDKIQSYLQQNISEIQKMLDARSVSGEYRSYKEVYDLVDDAVAEMKLYNPVWGDRENAWEGSMRSVRRVMTTAEANAAISATKAELTK